MERVEAFSAGPSEINARAEQHTLPDLYGLATASRAAPRLKTNAALAGWFFSRFAVGQPSDCSPDKKLYRAKNWRGIWATRQASYADSAVNYY